MNKQQRRWLKTISDCSSGGGMYPGVHADFVPNNPARHLERDGYIELYMPHNPVHKDRWVVTEKGREALRR